MWVIVRKIVVDVFATSKAKIDGLMLKNYYTYQKGILL